MKYYRIGTKDHISDEVTLFQIPKNHKKEWYQIPYFFSFDDIENLKLSNTKKDKLKKAGIGKITVIGDYSLNKSFVVMTVDYNPIEQINLLDAELREVTETINNVAGELLSKQRELREKIKSLRE